MFLEIIAALIVVLLTAVFKYRRRRKTHSFEHSFVVITGCDTGFGRLAAERFDNLGMIVFAGCLLQKSIKELKDTCSNKILPLILDVTKQDDIRNLLSVLNRELHDGLGLTGLINNAGISGISGFMESIGSEQYLSAFRVNLFGMVDVTKALLPLLRKGEGRIINTSSYAGKVGGPYFAPYFSSKHAVESFSDSLRRELYHDNVSVHIIEPGAFKTNVLISKIFQNHFMETFRNMPPASRDFYGEDMAEQICKYVETFEAKRNPDLDKVVNAYQHALTSSYPKIRYKVGIDCKILIAMAHYIPDWITDHIIASQFPIPAGVNNLNDSLEME